MAAEESGFRRAQELFLESIKLPPAEREAFVRRSTSQSRDLVDEVLELLRYHMDEEPLPAAAHSPPSIADFRIIRLLGSGNMGSVYLGEHRRTGLLAAVKVLSHDRMTHSLRERFRIEGEIVSRLDHPGIARFYEAGIYEAEGVHTPYYVMEFIDGISLREFIRPERASDRGRLLLLSAICDAIHYAHEMGVIHRDLKPENILVDASGQPKILDFGIARLIDIDPRATLAMTTAGAILGTLAYMSPEQARGAGTPLDGRSDVYSLGMIGYELLTGRLPYEVPRDSMERVIATILTTEPRPAGRLRPGLRGNVERILRHALAKAPSERYASAQAMAEDIRRHLDGRRPRNARPRFRLRPRGRSAGLLVAALAVATLAPLLIPRALRHSQPSPREIAAQVTPTLVEAERLIHWEPHGRESLTEGVRILLEARRRLLEQPDSPTTRAMIRFINWRIGEAHYFLGGIDSDPSELRTAGAFWRAANAIGFDRHALAGIDTTHAIYVSMARVAAHHPSAGIGLAEASLSFHEKPVEHLRKSVRARRSALEIYETTGPDGYVPSRESLRCRDEDAGILRNDLSASLTALGAATDSLPLIDEALRELRRAENTPALREYPDIRGSILRNIGLARLERAERQRSVADLDTAKIYLDRLADLQSAGGGGTSLSSALLARANLIGATMAEAPEVRRGMLEDAVRGYQSALDLLEGNADSITIARRRRDLAGALGEMASDRRDLAALDRGDSLIASAAGILTEERFPIQHAAVLLTQGTLARTRWQITGEETFRQAARAHLRSALAILPRVHDPSFARRVQEEGQRLGTPRERTP